MKRVLVVSMIAVLAGCAVPAVKTMEATGGSKADGTVKMSYEYGMFEEPKVDKEKALATATSRCTAWGYTGAEAFGSATKQCTDFDRILKACATWMATVTYQCTGQPK